MKLQGVHQNLLLKAIELAKQSTMIQKHGAVMFYQNHIYSNGINSCNRSRIMGKDYPSIHAEIDCIARNSGQSKKCILSPKKKSKIQHFGCTCKSFRKIGRLKTMYYMYSRNEGKWD
jgi:hypothetical protein